jgi:hypothetical protein
MAGSSGEVFNDFLSYLGGTAQFIFFKLAHLNNLNA